MRSSRPAGHCVGLVVAMVICSLAVAGTGTAVALVDTPGDQTGELDEAGSSGLLEASALVLNNDLGDTVNDTTNDTEDTVNDTTNDTEDTVNETTGEIDDTSETLEDTTESLEETTETIEDTTVDTTDTDTLETLADTVDDTDETLEKTTTETVADGLETIDHTVAASFETIDDTIDDTGEALEETTTTLSDTTDTVLDSTDVNDTVQTALLDQEASHATNVTTGDGTETDGDEAVADENTASGPLGVATAEPSPSTQTAVNGILAGLLGAVAVSSMGAGVAGAGAGAGTAGGTVASWTGRSRVRRLWSRLRDASPISLAALLRYSRYDDSDPLENERRKAIFEAVTAEPGLYLSAVSDHSDVPLSTVRHHVRILEEESLITSIKVDGKRRYFPIDADDVELHAAFAEPTRRRLLEKLVTLGQAPNGQLADALDRDPSTISHHLTKLEEAGLVIRERDGRSVVNELSPVATTLLLDTEASQPRPQPVPADD